MTSKKTAPAGERTPSGALNDVYSYYTIDECKSSNGLVVVSAAEFATMPSPHTRGELKDIRPSPCNASILRSTDRWWPESTPPERFFWRAIRLNAPEPCWVLDCGEGAFRATYPIHHDGRGLVNFGVDLECPFLCHHHYEVDEETWATGSGTHYTEMGSAYIIAYRQLLQPLSETGEVGW